MKPELEANVNTMLKKWANNNDHFIQNLTLSFIILKLLGRLDSWSWIWVLSPLWIALCVAINSIIIALIWYFIVLRRINRRG